MSWWGKLVGGAFGYMVGGPLGALLGVALGHNFDRGIQGLPEDELLEPGARERVQTAFFTATFAVMGHLAKADGRVSEDEISLARAVMLEMDLPPDERRAAMRLFEEGKSPDFPLDDVLDQFRRECRRRTTLIQMFVEIQIQAAYADGVLDAAEERILLNVCRHLGFSEFVFRRLEQMVRARMHFAGAGKRREAVQAPRVPSLDDAYALLGVSRNASVADIKKSYRRLLSQHHPDKLVSKGLPEEMMKMAAAKTHEIRQAYERVKDARRF